MHSYFNFFLETYYLKTFTIGNVFYDFIKSDEYYFLSKEFNSKTCMEFSKLQILDGMNNEHRIIKYYCFSKFILKII